MLWLQIEAVRVGYNRLIPYVNSRRVWLNCDFGQGIYMFWKAWKRVSKRRDCASIVTDMMMRQAVVLQLYNISSSICVVRSTWAAFGSCYFFGYHLPILVQLIQYRVHYRYTSSYKADSGCNCHNVSILWHWFPIYLWSIVVVQIHIGVHLWTSSAGLAKACIVSSQQMLSMTLHTEWQKLFGVGQGPCTDASFQFWDPGQVAADLPHPLRRVPLGDTSLPLTITRVTAREEQSLVLQGYVGGSEWIVHV